MVVADFLDKLAAYGSGWTLGNFPWFTFQTVGGAVATGSHGSSLSYGSLSNDAQLMALDVVLANGTFVQMTSNSHPALWKAFQVSVGRLGVITAVTFKIQPNAEMYRYKVDVTVDHFLQHMQRVQDAYNKEGDAAQEVQELDGVMYCWFATRRLGSSDALWRSRSYWTKGKPSPAPAWSQTFTPAPEPGVLSDAQLAERLREGARPPVTRQPAVDTQRAAPVTLMDLGVATPRAFGDATGLTLSPLFRNGTYPARTAIIAESLPVYNQQTARVLERGW